MGMEALDHLVSSPLLIVHVVAALFALAVGPFNLVRRKRDRTHRMLGRTWVIAMVITAVTSFGIQRPFSSLSGLHALSAWTLISLALGVVAIRRGNVKAHQGNMIGSYAGLWAAFLFAALVPTRTLSQVTAAAPLTAVTTVVVILLAVTATWFVFRPQPAEETDSDSADACGVPVEYRSALRKADTYAIQHLKS